VSRGGLLVRFHGTRGSVPTPDPENARAGGNTSCISIAPPGGPAVLLDAGTGIRRAGRELPAELLHGELDIFLTHFHWDHVQGLPFFGPLHDRAARVRIHAPCQSNLCVGDILKGLMAPLYFPVPHDEFAAHITLHALEASPLALAGGIEIDSRRVQHPSNTHGYRIRRGSTTVAFVPDNELGADAAAAGQLAEFVRGARLLIHDAMLTEGEYATRAGWGHSTFRQAVQLAELAEVEELRLFHHSPDRSDAELERILECLRRDLAGRGSRLVVDIAREGDQLDL
jgi:phosphoribosyl 1,2-cyclic phosphodiesterase